MADSLNFIHMRKIVYFFLTLSIFSCGGGSEPEPGNGGTPPAVSLKEKISKTWSPQTVSENGTLVYTKGASNNIRSYYSSFKLKLQANGSVELTEVEGTKITGKWSLGSSDTRLLLQELNPAPSESGGVLEYSISAADDKKMTLSALKVNHKTGGTTNKYELVPE